MHARCKSTVLVRVAVHGKIDKVSTNPAIVEQSVALSGGAVSTDSCPTLLDLNQERKQRAFSMMYLFTKLSVRRDIFESRVPFMVKHTRNARLSIMRSVNSS